MVVDTGLQAASDFMLALVAVVLRVVERHQYLTRTCRQFDWY